MPSPTSTPILITVKMTSTAYAGEKITLFNQTRGGYITATLNKKGEVIVNPKDEGQTSWADEDTIVAEVNGRLVGYGTGTFSDDSFNITIADAADTTSPAVDL